MVAIVEASVALKSSRLSWVLSGSIIVSWFLAAVVLDQSPLAVQHSRRLLYLGAVNAALLEAGQWWRLVASQFLHVHAPHMFFNALAVLLVGSLIEQGPGGKWWLIAIYLIGGCVGQYASVVFYPTLVSTGASQALMALYGSALLMCRKRVAYLIVPGILVVQLGLDLWSAGTVKAGHGWGFLAGILLGSGALASTSVKA